MELELIKWNTSMQDVQIQNNLKAESIPLGKNLNIFKKVVFHYPEGNL